MGRRRDAARPAARRRWSRRSPRSEAEVADLDTAAWRWTLTWLEGRPIVELDDGTTLRYDPPSDSVGRSGDG